MGRNSLLPNIKKVTNYDGYIPIREMAEAEKKTVQTIYYRIKQGQYDVLDIGGLVLVKPLKFKPTKVEEKIKRQIKKEQRLTP